MNGIDPGPDSHRRYNPLLDEWLLVSPQRAARPWQGAEEPAVPVALPVHDPGCYLCPGNSRAGGQCNPHYTQTWVFDNDFSALDAAERGHPAAQGERSMGREAQHKLLQYRVERGICRVICYTPQHNLSLSTLDTGALRAMVDCWCEQTRELGARDDIAHVQIFENRGEAMGCSNPHPHGQVWAQQHVPNAPARELANMQRYFDANGSDLLGDYLALELQCRERIVFEDSDFVVVVPWWAVWPFETLVLARRRVAHLTELDTAERDSLARTLQRLASLYDALFECPFPYSMGVHQMPFDGAAYDYGALHLHFYPPLLRSASVRKFMVGYELLAEPQRDVSAEQSAARLREVLSGTGA